MTPSTRTRHILCALLYFSLTFAWLYELPAVCQTLNRIWVGMRNSSEWSMLEILYFRV